MTRRKLYMIVAACNVVALWYVYTVYWRLVALHRQCAPFSAFRRSSTNTSARASKFALQTLIGCESDYPSFDCSSGRTRSADFIATHRILGANRKHDRCAVVGSSSLLLNHKYGREIDSSSLIFRMNRAPFAGYESYVGSRPADVTSFGRSGTICPDERSLPTPNLRLNALLVLCYSADYPSAVSAKEACVEKYRLKIHHMSKNVIGAAVMAVRYYAWARLGELPWPWKRDNPTTGLRTVFFALTMCNEVHLYGFGSKGTDLWHYYDRTKKSEQMPITSHKFDLEYEILRDMGDEKFCYEAIARHLDVKSLGRVFFHCC